MGALLSAFAALLEFVCRTEVVMISTAPLVILLVLWIFFGPKDHLVEVPEDKKRTKRRQEHARTVTAAVREEHIVDTPHGPIHVTYLLRENSVGTLLTYHDAGLNADSSFASFFKAAEGDPIVSQFSLVHIHAPGQQAGAEPIDPKAPFPTVPQLAHQVQCVVEQLALGRVVGFGLGLGAHVLLRYATAHPLQLQGLLCVNATALPADHAERWALSLTSSLIRAPPSAAASGLLSLLRVATGLSVLRPAPRASTSSGCGGGERAMLSRFLTTTTLTHRPAMVRTVKEALKAQCGTNVLRLLRSWGRRPELTTTQLRNLSPSMPLLLVVTELPAVPYPMFPRRHFMADAEDIAFRSNKGRDCVLMVENTGPLATVESPDELERTLRVFLRGLGFAARSETLPADDAHRPAAAAATAAAAAPSAAAPVEGKSTAAAAAAPPPSTPFSDFEIVD